MEEFAVGKFDALVDGDPAVSNTLNAQQRPIPWVLLFWVHKESSHHMFSGYSQFDNQSVGHVRGYGYPQEFLEYTGFGRLYDVTDDLQGLKMLNGKRFEAFFGDFVNNTQLVNTHNLNLRSLAPAVKVSYLTLSISDKLPEEHRRFEAALNQMYEDGSIDALYEKYLGMTYKEFVAKYGTDQ